MKLKPKALELQVKKSFSAYYDKANEEVLAERPQDPRRVFFLRPSSFPYCGLRRLLDWKTTLEDEGKSYMDAGGLFYVSVGTAFHNIFQEVLGKKGQLLGNWVCPKCKDRQTFTYYSRCRPCDRTRRYEELEVTFKKTLLGHVDGVFFDQKTQTYWVIDYKSTSGFKIWKHEKNHADSPFPYNANIAQIRSYVPLLERAFNIKISGYILAYLPRDNPMKAKVLCVTRMGPKSKALEFQRLKNYVRTHRRVLIAKSIVDVEAVYDNKLCSSAQDYKDNHHNKYSPCPHVKYCFDKGRMVDKTTKVLGSKVYPIIKLAPRPIRDELGL